MKSHTLFVAFILLGVYEPSYAKQPVTHSHNDRTHTHFLPQSGLNHNHGVKKKVSKKTHKSKNMKKSSQKKNKVSVRRKKEGIADTGKKNTQSEKKPRVVVRHTRAINPLSGSPTDCVVKATITSDTNFTSMTTDRGGGADSYDAYPVYIERMYILNAHTRKPYVTLDFNPSIRKRKNFTDHRTGKKYSTTSHTFSNILDGYTYIATLGGGWITEPSSVTFSCPNERGQRKFSLPRIKHIGIMGDG